MTQINTVQIANTMDNIWTKILDVLSMYKIFLKCVDTVVWVI